MKIMDLPVEPREKLGSSHARRYRRAGRIPVNLYGGDKENVNLVTTVDDFDEVLKEHTALVRLKQGEKAQTALVRDVRWNVFGDHVEHIDLKRVGMKDEVKLRVPIHVLGIPAGTSEGGVLEVVQPDVEVEARVDAIPSDIPVDVSEMHIGDGVHLEDLAYPEHVRPAGNPQDLVLHVVEPKKPAEPEEGEEGELAEGEEAAEGEGAEDAGEKSDDES